MKADNLPALIHSALQEIVNDKQELIGTCVCLTQVFYSCYFSGVFINNSFSPIIIHQSEVFGRYLLSIVTEIKRIFWTRHLHGDWDGQNEYIAGIPRGSNLLPREIRGVCLENMQPYSFRRSLLISACICWMTYKPSVVTWQPLTVDGQLFPLGLRS